MTPDGQRRDNAGQDHRQIMATVPIRSVVSDPIRRDKQDHRRDRSGSSQTGKNAAFFIPLLAFDPA